MEMNEKGQVAGGKWPLLTHRLLSDRATLDLTGPLVEMEPLESR